MIERKKHAGELIKKVKKKYCKNGMKTAYNVRTTRKNVEQHRDYVTCPVIA